ncbi:hypothetical protein BB8028_0004g10620 [Beauveria bassiana]|uniref:Uncharacterized protein n=1 Tax=Beauveria bassiana TaxID=176275 RepID=A0A2S7YE35_BEABA|nr:hypothetical protein BB8028_0004g10620 [Beauveria bassiana]
MGPVPGCQASQGLPPPKQASSHLPPPPLPRPGSPGCESSEGRQIGAPGRRMNAKKLLGQDAQAQARAQKSPLSPTRSYSTFLADDLPRDNNAALNAPVSRWLGQVYPTTQRLRRYSAIAIDDAPRHLAKDVKNGDEESFQGNEVENRPRASSEPITYLDEHNSVTRLMTPRTECLPGYLHNSQSICEGLSICLPRTSHLPASSHIVSGTPTQAPLEEAPLMPTGPDRHNLADIRRQNHVSPAFSTAVTFVTFESSSTMRCGPSSQFSASPTRN